MLDDYMQPSQSPGGLSADAGHEGEGRTPDDSSLGEASAQTAFPQRDDSSERASNERLESDLETDQMEHLLGDEAIQDGEFSDEEFPADVSEDF
jgi:hypothetical protein